MDKRKKTVYMKTPAIWKEAEAKVKKADSYMSLSRLIEALLRAYAGGKVRI